MRDVDFKTSLPAGQYCDVISGDFSNGQCSGNVVTVDAGGYVTLTAAPNGAAAIHVGARVGGSAQSPQTASVTFNVTADTVWGQNLFVVGHHSALGSWSPAAGRWLARWPLSAWMVLVCVVAALRFGATAAFGTSLVVLVLAQVSHALTFATHHTVCVAFINRHFADRLRGRGQALYSVLGYGLPGVLGGVAGGALGGAWGWASVFWAAALAALLAALAAWRVARIEA